MRKALILLAPIALGVAACSPSEQQNVNNSLDRAGDSIENAANDAGDAIANTADDAGDAASNFADDVGDRADRVGNAIENETR
jgi:hypothetical protein